MKVILKWNVLNSREISLFVLENEYGFFIIYKNKNSYTSGWFLKNSIEYSSIEPQKIDSIMMRLSIEEVFNQG